MKRLKPFYLLLLVFSYYSSSVTAQELADTRLDFSLSQGANGFSYGYYPGDVTTGSFSTSGMVSDGTNWVGTGGEIIGDEFMHPSWTGGFTRTAVRRYAIGTNGEQSYTGSVLISGKFWDEGNQGGGTIGFITVDGVTLYSQAVPVGSTETSNFVTYSVAVSVSPNSTIDFGVRQNGSTNYDGTRMDGTISTTTSSGLPIAPTGLTASAVSSSQINLSWVDNSDNETGFEVERSTSSGSDFSLVATTQANVSTYSSTGLLESTTYYYRVRAINGLGQSGYSDQSNATTLLNTFQKPRVLVSTDMGFGNGNGESSDEDDQQSMVHYLLYADIVDTEGVVSSPPFGRVGAIHEVYDAYELDFPNLSTWGNYPTRTMLDGITAQGALAPTAPGAGKSTAGSNLIIQKAQINDSRPLHILVWGSITDIAQALFDSPTIKSKIRVYSIGLWNTSQDQASRDYIYNNHSDLWWIENNTTFIGMFLGGNQTGDLGNTTFIDTHIAGHGNLGDFYVNLSRDAIQMGDTPSFFYILSPLEHDRPSVGNIDEPTVDSWGGAFVKTNHGPNYWTDNTDPAVQEGVWNWPPPNGTPAYGAKTVNKWREDFLRDFQLRMDRVLGSSSSAQSFTKNTLQSMELVAYPNPTSGNFTIQSPIFKYNFKMDIVNKLNRNINYTILEKTEGTMKIKVNASVGGIYFLKLYTSDGVRVKKIIVKK